MTTNTPVNETVVMSRPTLSFWQIWNMSFGFLGIQFGFALQNANVSRIFETLGASVENIPILWVAAPVTGLLIQPIIGYMSDHTWNRLGRRRPYFLTGAILASLALIVMPNSPALWIAAGMLWIMDASINVSMEPFRAFVGDMLPSHQRTQGFAMQSFFIGTGAVVASLLPYIMSNWFGIANTAPDGEIPPSVKISFYVGAIAFLSAVLWTVISTKEYSPEQLKAFEVQIPEKAVAAKQKTQLQTPGMKMLRLGFFWLAGGLILTLIIYITAVQAELYIFSGGCMLYGIVQIVAGFLTLRHATDNGFVEVVNDLNHMPSTMVQLAVVQFFSWFALFSMWIYTTPAVTHHIYGTSDTTSALYNEGADWVSVCFGVYNGVAALIAFALQPLANATSRKTVHMIALILGGLGLASIYVITQPGWLIASMIGVGIAWASILSMPYAILAGALPANKMGTYMGIFNFFIVIPQITAAGILGVITKNFFGGEAVFALVTGGIAMIVAGLLVTLVKDVDDVQGIG